MNAPVNLAGIDRDAWLAALASALPPRGRPVEVSIKRPKEIAQKAGLILDAGYRFEAEVLGDGSISLTITNDDGDAAIEVCSNGPDVPLAVDRLIGGFDVGRPS